MSNLENNNNIHGMNDKDFENLFNSQPNTNQELDPSVFENTINVQEQPIQPIQEPKNNFRPLGYEEQFKKQLDEREEMMKNTGHEVLNAINPATVAMAEQIIAQELGNEAIKDVQASNVSINVNEPYTSLNLQEPAAKTNSEQPEMLASPVAPEREEKITETGINLITPEDTVIKIRETTESMEKYEEEIVSETKAKVEKAEQTYVEYLESRNKQRMEYREKDFQPTDDIDINIKTDTTEDSKDEDEVVKKTIELREQFTSKAEELVADNAMSKQFYGGNTKDPDAWPFREKTNAWAKKFAEIPLEKIPEKIIGKPFVLTDDNFDAYVTQRNRFNGLSMTKVALPFSGITLYVRAFKNSTFTKLIEDLARWDSIRIRAKQSKEELENYNAIVSEAYIKLRRTELEAIYRHVDSIYVAGKGIIDLPDMYTFFKMIKYPDLPHLYFAVYHGTNKNKRKKYNVTCYSQIPNPETGEYMYCGHQNQLEFYDEELVFALVNETFPISDFYKLLDDKCPQSTILPITREAQKEIERLTSTKTNIVHHVPSIYDYLETLDILLDFVQREDVELDVDLSRIDIEITEDKWGYQNYDITKLLKSYLYVKEISFLWVTNKKGDTEYRTISIENGQRQIIFDILLDLPYDDMLILTRGKEIAKLMTLKAFDYYIPEIKCQSCGTIIKPIKFDIRTNFFTLLADLRKNREQID